MLKLNFSKLVNKSVYYSLTDDESVNITATVQMCILAHGITNFEMFEEIVDLHSMQSQTKGSHFIKALLCSL
jgi:hypothetical protein